MERIYLNDNWEFTEEFTDALLQPAAGTAASTTPAPAADPTSAEPTAANLASTEPATQLVRIPHTCKELPFHYFSEQEYQMVCGYRKTLDIPADWQGRRLLLTFMGAAHQAEVFINGSSATVHNSGYTAFTIDISKLVNYGQSNTITVKLDTRESLNTPPFGFVIDYLTYGGIYRDVYLEVKEQTYIADVFLQAKPERFINLVRAEASLTSEISITGDTAGMTIRQSMRRLGTPAAPATAAGPQGASAVQVSSADVQLSSADTKLSSADGQVSSADGQVSSADVQVSSADVQVSSADVQLSSADTKLSSADGQVSSADVQESSVDVQESSADTKLSSSHELTLLGEAPADLPVLKWIPGEVELWTTRRPVLYEVVTELRQDGRTVDTHTDVVGFRTAEFRKDGFYLNDQKIRIRGLNRHQSYAYVGYAMPASMQRLDADILKYELGCNAVRTSHYPQSQEFIRRCDELGLLVFTEFPGWQHIGDEEWKNQAVTNLKEMVVQYRNHPSIILWGVRINESVDDDAFYQRTNRAAHMLDPTRQTGGVRCYKKGSLLEDVYTYNDFVHRGNNQGCEKKSAVTSHPDKPYLVTEYNGHMYPTKSFDWEEHRLEHALRHANVLNSVAENQDIAGSFGWCMFDYNTHKDFGSGDRICYHGVMDMFRNPKMAASVYAMQQDETPVLTVSSTMDIGEHPGSNRGEVYIFSNADVVRMYRGSTLIKEYDLEQSTHPALRHGPVLLDDYIGNLLETGEHMPHKQAEAVKALLNQVARYGMYDIPKSAYLQMGKLMLRYHMKVSDMVELFNKYIGNWGGASAEYRFEAEKDGRIVKTVTCAAMNKKNLHVSVSHTLLHEDHSYDVAAVRLQLQDEFGNVLPFANDPVVFRVSGDIQLIGPSIVSLQGGMGGCYIKTVGPAAGASTGAGTLTIEAQGCKPVNVEFTVRY